MFEIYTSDHEACIRSAIGFMARGINVKRLQRGSLELDGPTSAKTALVWISDNTDSFVNATPQGSSPEARFDAAATALPPRRAAYACSPSAPVLGGGFDQAMNALPAAAVAPKRKEAEIAHTSPHPAHSVRSVDGMMVELAKAEWIDSTPPGETLPQLQDAAAAMAAAAEPPAGPALPLVDPIDVDAAPSRTH